MRGEGLPRGVDSAVVELDQAPGDVRDALGVAHDTWSDARPVPDARFPCWALPAGAVGARRRRLVRGPLALDGE